MATGFDRTRGVNLPLQLLRTLEAHLPPGVRAPAWAQTAGNGINTEQDRRTERKVNLGKPVCTCVRKGSSVELDQLSEPALKVQEK